MVSKNLHKVQKQIAKKQNGKKKALHEHSRDARRIRQASRRQDKLAALLNTSNKARQPYVDRVFYFQSFLVPDDDESDHIQDGPLGPWAGEQLQQAAQNFIDRHDDELNVLESERRAGRPPSKRETALKQTKAAEHSEYSSGFWIPDLRDQQSVQSLNKWNGDWSGLGQLKYCRVSPNGSIVTSSFPPMRSV